MITREEADGIATLRLAHGKVSALDVELCVALDQQLEAMAAGTAKAVVLTGTGSSFSAGVDLFRVLDGGTAYLERFLPAMERLFRTLVTFPKPLVTAVNGHAIAGGCIIAAASDFRVMAEGNARIGVPELLVGVPFPTLPFEILRARLSPPDLRRLVLSGKTVNPAEALTLGFVDEVAPSDVLLTRAAHAAERLAAIPPASFALTKRAFAEPILQAVDAARPLNDAVVQAWSSEPVQARMRAYVAQTVAKK